jgi:hypothetical protein
MFPKDIARQTEYAAEQFAKMGGTSTLEAARLSARGKAIERASLRPDYMKALKAGDKDAKNRIINEEIDLVLQSGGVGSEALDNSRWGKLSVSNP